MRTVSFLYFRSVYIPYSSSFVFSFYALLLVIQRHLAFPKKFYCFFFFYRSVFLDICSILIVCLFVCLVFITILFVASSRELSFITTAERQSNSGTIERLDD